MDGYGYCMDMDMVPVLTRGPQRPRASVFLLNTIQF